MKKLKFLIVLTAVFTMLSACSDAAQTSIVVNTLPPASASVQTASPSPSLSSAATPTPTSTASPSPSPTQDPIDQCISKMSEKELIGQMVMIGFDGTRDMDSDRVKLLKDYKIGNIFLFGWNTDTFSQTKKLIKNVNSHNKSDIPLLVGIDLEGGSVIRFPGQWKPYLSSAKRLGESNSTKKIHDQYYRIGKQLKNMGIDVDFAPVLDIAHSPSSTFLNTRIFGSDPKKVSKYVNSAIDGLHDAKVASVGKHFPGIGDVPTDPHENLPVLKTTLEQAEKYGLIPFGSAVEHGIDGMMVTHLSYPKIDNKYISTVSPVFIGDILRKNMGFNGVVISDDLRMRGFTKKYSIGKGAVLFVQAGGDMVLIGKFPDLQKKVCTSLYNAVENGTITRERLEESVRRILQMKQKYCGFEP